MKNYFLKTATVLAMSIILAGCGGGGGTTVPPKTQGTTVVYLFGTMSSSSRVATLHSEITIPDGIMVNYSSPPGATSGKYPLRSGAITPSGPLKVAQSDVTAEFSVADRKLSIDYLNTPDFTTMARKNIKSSTTGSGTEIATLNFKLKTADVFPTLAAPWEDVAVSIYEETSTLNVINSTGLKLNFVTTFMP